VTVGPSVWLVPATSAFEEGIARASELVVRGGAEPLLLEVEPSDEAGGTRLGALYTAAREDEWQELLTECGRYLAELDREIAKEKFTPAELDEEEQSMERLRRWYREIRLRDVLGAPSTSAAENRLKECEAHLEHYTQLVFRHAHDA